MDIEMVQPSGRLPLEVSQALGGDPEDDPEPAGGIMYPLWTGNTFGTREERLFLCLSLTELSHEPLEGF